jgi:hypothetical protein
MPKPERQWTEKDEERARDIIREMIGPRCQECGGCDAEEAAKWAGEEYGWCYCNEEA